MKVLLINHFPLEGSGSGTYTKNIALHLRKRGHEVAVIFPENQPFPMLPGIQMHPVMFSKDKVQRDELPFNFPCFTTHPQSRTTFADLGVGKLTRYLTAFSAALRQALQEFHPDIIHAQHAWCLSWLASLCNLTWDGADGLQKVACLSELCRGGRRGKYKSACHLRRQSGPCY